MKESDWKKFKKIKALALDRFCARAMADFQAALQKDEMSNHERYLSLYALVQDADERLSMLFDGHSRSKAQLQLAFICSEGLVEDYELEGMSAELIKATQSML